LVQQSLKLSLMVGEQLEKGNLSACKPNVDTGKYLVIA
jgi:hypothetical protein